MIRKIVKMSLDSQEPIDFETILTHNYEKFGSEARLGRIREILLDILLDKYCARVSKMSDFQLLSEAKDWGVF